uniref:Transposon protein, putative, Mutator sub-class n=1 Tax=Oryza sativa subsp. japonica TaxID=39947 RepID=Q2QRB3_ORYSJ|nr:transposon protein, putative, Mutator sub-class [Oryza sativa Japonica Group]ABA98179.1 transposon protein, putative, Mutator sub-class [Oryza sativa Japonica Group]
MRLKEEPALSLAVVELEIDHAIKSVYIVAPDGIVEPVPVQGDYIVGEDKFYELLGLRAEDEVADEARQAAARGGGPDVAGAAAGGVGGAAAAAAAPGASPVADEDDITGAAIPVDDQVPGERVMAYDPNNSCMKAGTVYPNMKEFRLAMRQFAINAEFELKLVTVLQDLHTCTSSSRRKTTTPTAKWVASNAIPILKKNPGLEKVVHTVFEHAEQRECFWHLMKNFVKRFGGDVHSHIYPAARAYRKEIWQSHTKEVIEACSDVLPWLEAYHPLKWMRSGFNPAIKQDRVLVMVLWNKRRRIAEKMTGNILPAVTQKLKARTRGLGHLSVVKSDSFCAEIVDNSTTHEKHVVKAYNQYCSCEEWQHTGKPCQHALALITSQQNRDVNIEDFVNPYFSVELFRKAYRRIIEPLGDKSYWPQVELPWVLGAPLPKKTNGRYIKLRIKSCLEGGGKSKAKTTPTDNDSGKRVLRKPRRNTTKYGNTSDIPSPKRPTVQTILEESLGRITRSRLASLMKGGAQNIPASNSQPADIPSSSSQPADIRASSSQPTADIGASSSQPAASSSQATSNAAPSWQPRMSPRKKLTPKKKLKT